METKRDQKYIPRFSFKSSLLILLAGIFGGVLLPYLFYRVNLNLNIAELIFLPISIALSISYSQCFIETNDKFGKRFWRIFLISLIATSIATFAWLFKGIIF